MFTSLLDEVAAQGIQGEVQPRRKPVPPSPSLSLPRPPRTRGLAKLAKRATRVGGASLLPAGSVIHVDAEPLSSIPFRADKGKQKVREEAMPTSEAGGPVIVEGGPAEARKKQRPEGDGKEARLLLSTRPAKFECELTEEQRKGDVHQSMAEAVFCTPKVLESLQFLKERAESVDEGSVKLAEATERYEKSLEMIEYKVDQASAKVRLAEIRVLEAEQREKEGQKERAELSQKITDLELRLARQEKVHGAERKGWETKLQQAEEQALSTFRAMLPTLVKRLVQTKTFATLFAKIAEPALRFGRHQGIQALRAVYPAFPKSHARGWDEAAGARLNYTYNVTVKEGAPEFPLLTHLISLPKIPTAEEVLQCSVDRLEALDVPLVEPPVDPEAVPYSWSVEQLMAKSGVPVAPEHVGEGLKEAQGEVPIDPALEEARLNEDMVQPRNEEASEKV